MPQGTGEDGCRTMLAGGNRVASTLLSSSRGRADELPDCNESNELSLWSAAPGAVVVLPERYTPTYAYPALIWLAEPDETEFSARGWLEEISSRNFVGIGLRPELYAATRSGQVASASVGAGLSRFHSLLKSMESWVRLHPHRRYVAGAKEAGIVATRWLLTRPEWFAGGIVMDLPATSSSAWRAAAPVKPGRRLLWIDRSENDSHAADIQSVALRCLGIDVTRLQVAGETASLTIASRINRWVLESIPTAVID